MSNKCIICRHDIADPTDYDELEGAGEVKLLFGFGSSHDTREYKGYICDGCMDQLRDDKIVTHYRCYLDNPTMDQHSPGWEPIDDLLDRVARNRAKRRRLEK